MDGECKRLLVVMSSNVVGGEPMCQRNAQRKQNVKTRVIQTSLQLSKQRRRGVRRCEKSQAGT